jgi:hypothetical protein
MLVVLVRLLALLAVLPEVRLLLPEVLILDRHLDDQLRRDLAVLPFFSVQHF